MHKVGFGIAAYDPAKITKKNPGHEDYCYTAAVSHAALDGEPDVHSEDDDCPYSVDPPLEVDGKIKDRGCWKRKPDRTFGEDVLRDVVRK